MKYLSLRALEEFSNIERIKSEETNNDSNFNSSFFHGKFKKYSATLDGEHYIIKVKEEGFPELPDVEYVCNRISRAINLDIAEFFTMEFFGERAFITKNFISKNSGPENLSHIYHYFDNKQKFDCKTIIEIIRTETKNILEIDKFIKICLFDSLIGNSDRHGRNIAFISSGNTVKLSPVYDNPSALGLEKGDLLKADWNPRGKIATTAEENPSIAEYAREFKNIGYNKLNLDFLKVILKKHQTIENIISKSFCSDLMKAALKRLINKRLSELKNEIT